MLMGGSVESGAATAAYGYLFNKGGKAVAKLATKGSELLKDFIEASDGVEIADQLYLRHDVRVSIADGVYDMCGKQLQVSEVKLGCGGYTCNQKAVYPKIDSGEVEMFSKNAPKVAEALGIQPAANGKYYLPKGTFLEAHSFTYEGQKNHARSKILNDAIKNSIRLHRLE